MCLSRVDWTRNDNRILARKTARGKGKMWKVFNPLSGSKTGLRFPVFEGARLRVGKWMTASQGRDSMLSYPAGYHGFTDYRTAKRYAARGQLILRVEWRGKLAVGRQEPRHPKRSAIVVCEMRIPRGWRKDAVAKGERRRRP